MALPLITSVRNARVRLARVAERGRDLDKRPAIKLEGQRLVLDALGSGLTEAAQTIMLTDEAIERGGDELHDGLAGVAPGVCVRVSPHVMEAASDHRNTSPPGVLAVLDRPTGDLDDCLRPLAGGQEQELLLVCDGVSDPGNLGTLIRSAAAAGASGVICTDAAGGCDPYSPKVLRAGMGAHFKLPGGVVPNASVDEVLERFDKISSASSSESALFVATSATLDAAVDYFQNQFWRSPTSAAALVVGNETRGVIDARWIDRGGGLAVSIPMSNHIESLNVGVAGSIMLFEAARQRASAAQ